MTQRRVFDNDRQLAEIFPSSQDRGSTPEVDDGNTSYVSANGSTCDGVYVSGLKWERTTTPPTSAAARRLTDPFDYPLTALSPSQALAELAPIVTAIRPVGSATIDGVHTTKFALTVSSAQMESFMSAGLSPTDPTIRFTLAMWVDSTNRLRQSQITQTAPGQHGETVTNRYSHFGIPVNITIPPASEVVTNCGP